jgi:hypothetical protein
MSTINVTNVKHPSAVDPAIVLSSDGNVENSVIINAQGGAYTLALTDRNKQVEMSGGSTLTVPLNSSVAFPVGSSILIVQTGASQVTVAGAGGVTVNSSNGLKLFGQWSAALLVKRATNTWLLAGDTAA